jgi:transcriptional regulator with XRE-family HTH domain
MDMDGLELKLARVSLGLTQYEFGKLVDVHPSRLSEMERGQREITADVIEALQRLKEEGRP